MADPQLEKGYTPIANEILHALMACKLLSYEFRTTLAVIRKTYGWKKKVDWLSNSQLSEITGIAKPNITRTVKALVSKKVLIKNGKLIGLQKDWELWEVEWYVDKKVISRDNLVISPDNKKLSHEIPTKERKETIQNKISENKFSANNSKKNMAWNKYNEDEHYNEKSIDIDTGEEIEQEDAKLKEEQRKERADAKRYITGLRDAYNFPKLDAKQMNWQIKDYLILRARGWGHKDIGKEFINIATSDLWKEKMQNKEYPGMNTVEYSLRNKSK